MSSQDPQKITITICGDGGCGKSSITLRLVRSQWTHEYDPTIEDSYSLSRTIDGQTYHLSLTDTAGQEEYRGMWASSNLKSDAFLLVYDITNLSSLGVLSEFNDLIDIEAEMRLDAWDQERGGGGGGGKKNKGSGRGEIGPVKPIKIVAGNKCDLQESRQVSASVGLEWARKRGCGFMETSARNTVNIEETFALIVRRVVEARRQARGLGVEEGRTRLNSSGTLGGMSLNVVGPGTGTRRAVTAPLSPLPGGPEKEMSLGDGNEKGSLGDMFRGLWKLMQCWR